QMKHYLFFLLLFARLTLAQDETQPGTAPQLQAGIVACGDGSRWHGFTFAAQAGWEYELQSSADLTDWRTEESFMGWGENRSVLMKEVPQPVAGPPGEIPAPRPRLPMVHLLMRPASGGGLVLAWRSLEDGGPLTWCFPNLTLGPGWEFMPGYVQRFTTHEFLISHPDLAQEPPTVNPVAGPKDAAMLAEFEAHFSSMNAEVAASLARMQAQPIVAAVPGGKRFYRIVAESEIDSDADGTVDRLEIAQMFERAAGGSFTSGPAPDPFDGDTDGNGLADGGERSSDGDSASDSEDAAPDDPLVDWKKLPPYRYTLFPLPDLPSVLSLPLQTCDFGNVLYDNRLFSGGILKVLPEPTEMSHLRPGFDGAGLSLVIWVMDDTGSPYAWGLKKRLMGDKESAAECLLSWTPQGESPSWLMDGTDGWIWPHLVYQSAISSYSRDMFIPTLIGGTHQERALVGATSRPTTYTSPGSPEILYGAEQEPAVLWTLSGVKAAGAPVKTSSALSSSSAYTVAPDGSPMGSDWNANYFVGDHIFPENLQRVVRLPSNELMAIPESGPPWIRKNGEWKLADKSFKETLVDISPDTGFFFHKFDGKAWQNGRVLEMKDWAPGIHPKAQFSLIDAAPAGPLIADYTSWESGSSTQHVLGLPLYVEGVDASVSPPKNNDLSAGVDSTSLQALGGSAKMNTMWIMAPIGGDAPTTVRFLSASNETNSLRLECFAATFDNGSSTSKDRLEAKDQLIKVTGTGTETRDYNMTLQLAGTSRTSLNTIVKVKSMKKRTVKVALHKVIGLDEHEIQTTPILFPEESVLEAYLNKVYGRQVNTFFDVTVYEERGPDKANDAEEGIDFD
ncbi:hypothetical protein, partial [Flavobacterium sp.]|uniref:hypothetical protein n=1 Tax=Flavobacterium sp. TaxID=239 RepID=UPI0032655ED9